MNYYLDITLIPNEEIPLNFLWEKLFQQLHLALVEQAYEAEETIPNREKKITKKSKVAVAFPKYKQCGNTLCEKLRLFAMSETDLKAIDLEKYFSKLDDFVHKTSIKKVPTEKITGYAFFKRVAIKGNSERLARRRKKRLSQKGVQTNYEEALNYFQGDQNRKQSSQTETKLPFIYLNSETTNQRFPLFIEMVSTEHKPDKAEFSCYGLSDKHSVPIF